jgi:hypothetical protein
MAGLSVFAKLAGIIGDLFHIGGPAGPILKNNGSTVEVKKYDDSAFWSIRTAHIGKGASAATADDVPTLLDLQGRIPNIHFAFDGAAAPAGGTHTGAFGICHTTGGSYTIGDVVYDNGVALEALPTDVCRHITTEIATGGTLALLEDCFYALEGGSWILKGDGTVSDLGLVKTISVAFAHDNLTPSSTAAIPAGALILRAQVDVTEVFDGAAPATLLVQVGALTIMATADSSLAVAGIYQVPQQTTATNDVVAITTTVGGGNSTGEGVVLIDYVAPLT